MQHRTGTNPTGAQAPAPIPSSASTRRGPSRTLADYPDIERSEREAGRTVAQIIDPSPGLWGGDPVPGLVTVEYACSGEHCQPTYDPETFERTGYTPRAPHTHQALYGPRVHFPDGWRGAPVPTGEPGYELYAD